MSRWHTNVADASGRVLAKAGFTGTGTSVRHADDGTAVAYQVYALPKEDDVLVPID
ncbi:hypothetical protein [Streptomyces sp. G7(2002)]|uniref:hypothetical protein n=1 Tax=Streptomyces sp. G7(2002) TaxID=2971798 RepID=UPI00237E9E45|nr:hypothetical protein [Streptomyces sp. G7(2002)]WDT60292.1 hypothetical protein NUT86_33245 [Streptomyces sp. G7(2002)]